MLPDELFVAVELTPVLETMLPVGDPSEVNIDAEFATIVAGINKLARSPEVLSAVLVGL